MNGLVGWWKMDEGTGTSTTADSSGQGNIGTLQNSPTWVSGIRSVALKFVASSNQDVSVPNNTSLNVTANITVSAWVYPLSISNYAMVVCKGGVNSAYEIFSNTDGGNNWIFRIGNGGSWQDATGPAAVLNVWTQVIGTYDGSILSIYINGALAGSTAVSGNILTNGQPLGIGSCPINNNFYWDGHIDDVRIYNRAITATEANDLYLMGIGRVVYGKNSVISNSKTSF